jgi:hypothetical protein
MDEARVTVVSTGIEAEMLCGLLRSNGIPCFSRLTDFGAGSVDALSRGLGATEIVVRPEDLEQAREVLGLEGEGCAE